VYRRRADRIGVCIYGRELQVSTRMPRPVATSFLAVNGNVNEYGDQQNPFPLILRHRWTNARLFGPRVGRGSHSSRTIRYPALNQQCRDEATEFGSEAESVTAGSKVVGYKAHYNLQRRQCLVDITSNRPGNGGAYSKEQIFDPKDGTFVASCDRLSGASQTSAIVLGAPVPIEKEGAAQAWFNDLMRK
jgi:hypothetical protein